MPHSTRFSEMDVVQQSVVSEYYRGKTIFVTGGTGSIGKVLIWKLLRSCSGVDTIFVLIRPKRGKTAQDRLDELLQTPIFDNFRKEKPQLLEKIRAIPGDVGCEGLGLSEDDERELLNSVHVIFHAAALVKFEANLKEAVKMNVGGTQTLLEMAKRMPNLEAFVYISTAYCLWDVPELGEKLYKAKDTPKQILDLVASMKPDILHSIENDVITPHPNTYAFSKRLAENMVAGYHPNLPVVITRPTIVSPSRSEPLPGWTDSVSNTLVGLSLGSGKGVLRVFLCDEQCHADMVPMDFVCNSLILVAWKTGQDTRRPEEIPVYNVGILGREKIAYKEISNCGHRMNHTYPFSNMMWYPFTLITSNVYLYTALSICLQWIPAYVTDALLVLLRRKTFMVRLQRKIDRSVRTVAPTLLREWDFEKRNILQIRDGLSVKDRNTFEVMCDGTHVIDAYYRTAHLLARWYLMKEDPDTIPAARRSLKLLYAMHCFVKLALWLYVGRIFWRRIGRRCIGRDWGQEGARIRNMFIRACCHHA